MYSRLVSNQILLYSAGTNEHIYLQRQDGKIIFYGKIEGRFYSHYIKPPIGFALLQFEGEFMIMIVF